MSNSQSVRDRTPGAREWIAQNEKFETRRGHHLAYRRRGTGPTVLMLHGFPTWSYDFSGVATDLESDYDVITMDFLGYGASDKPNPYEYSVAEGADCVEDLLALLHVSHVHLAVHDFGSIVGQEMVDRELAGKLPFTIDSFSLFNSGVIFSGKRPTLLQRMLMVPVLGGLIASNITVGRLRSGLEGVMGKRKPSDKEFEELWYGISLKNGHRLAHLHIRYDAERAQHHLRWEAALAAWKGPLHLIWGLDDPVSGRNVLELAVKAFPNAVVHEIDDVGHFPPLEAPDAVAEALRAALAASAPASQ